MTPWHRRRSLVIEPQDFVEEWITRPWSEMQSRSAQELQPWHQDLDDNYGMGNYVGVGACAPTPGSWLIALDIRTGKKELSEPKTTYFVVMDLGNYRYHMEEVGLKPPPRCSAMGYASGKHPWLSPAVLRAIP